MAVATDASLSFYLDDFTDELMPCGTSLSEWATWLSKPDEDWHRDAAAKDGEHFKSSVTRWQQDIIARRDAAGAWSFSAPIPVGATTVAVRFGQGLGWDPDNIIWGEDMQAALASWFAENEQFCDDEEFIAIGMPEPEVMLVYRSDPPRLLVEGPVQ